MATPQTPQQLGTINNITVANSTPSGASAGFATDYQRFVNVWLGLTGGTSVDVVVWVWRTNAGWINYVDVPQTTVLTTNGGGFFQFELRGAERVYIQLLNLVGPPSCSLIVEGVTY